MSYHHLTDEVGNWRKEKMLGAGGFGYVILWRNKVSGELLALKECRWGQDPTMTPKNRSRWKAEVDMMSHLDHPNVVRALPVPPELDVPSTELPLLAMEYCSCGDLRKVLNKPESCCGLPENQVRLIIRHVSSAVNYLHSKKIIHRDLKPENIVIQDKNGSTVYKLIDLGYAKELDQSSLCTSFVGTLQYLAPELFMSQKYSCTVDYWSLGLVVHEIITGLRPFLPFKSPAEWIPVIKRKDPSQIRAYLDEDKNIVFSDEISPYHYVTKSFKANIEKWLRLMLEWDPKRRGRTESTTAFAKIDEILRKKACLVFCVDSGEMLCVDISDSMPLEEFTKEIGELSGIDVEKQDFLLPNGSVLDASKSTEQLDLNSQNEPTVFLFNKSLSSPTIPSNFVFPHMVDEMMRHPHREVDYLTQRTVWSQAVFLSTQQSLRLDRLVQAFKASLVNLLLNVSHCHKSMLSMTTETNKLLAKCTFFQSCLEMDMNSYEKQVKGNNGFTCKTLYDGWKSILENIKNVDILRQKEVNLSSFSSSINMHTVELQKSLYAKAKFPSSIENVHQAILNSYSEVKKRPKEKRSSLRSNVDMARLLCICLEQSHAQTKDIAAHIKQARQLKVDIEELLPQIANLVKEISEWDAQIDIWQQKRQRDIWKVVGALNSRVHQAERASPIALSSSPQPSMHRRLSSPPLVVNGTGALQLPGDVRRLSLRASPPIITPPTLQSRLETLSLNASSTSLVRSGPLSLVLDRVSEETHSIAKENESIIESFHNMMGVLKSFQTEDSSTLQDEDEANAT